MNATAHTANVAVHVLAGTAAGLAQHRIVTLRLLHYAEPCSWPSAAVA